MGYKVLVYTATNNSDPNKTLYVIVDEKNKDNIINLLKKIKCYYVKDKN